MHLAVNHGPLMGYLPHHIECCVAPSWYTCQTVWNSNELLRMLASLHVELVDITLTFDVVPVQQTATKEDLQLPGMVLFNHVLASAYRSFVGSCTSKWDCHWHYLLSWITSQWLTVARHSMSTVQQGNWPCILATSPPGCLLLYVPAPALLIRSWMPLNCTSNYSPFQGQSCTSWPS